MNCKMCRKELSPEMEKELLCEDCFNRLQDSYGEVCLGCGKYEFIDWTVENVTDLGIKLGVPPEMLWNSNMIIIIPFLVCPDCGKEKEVWG